MVASARELLFADSWHDQLRRFRSDFAFRGEGDARNDLATSLMRLGGDYAAVETHLLRNVLLPAGLRWEVRDKLDQANIAERVLFPGLDGIATWLKRYFSPRT